MRNADGKEVTTKPWQLSQWKKIRAEKIGDKCLQCGSTEQPLVLHHLRQPLPANMIRLSVASELFHEHISDGKIELNTIIRSFCPDCGSIDIRQRKTINPPWICNRCHHKFESPKSRPMIDNQEAKHLFRQFNLIEKELITEKTRAEFQKAHDRYMSCEDTKTFCKKCAFLWDKKGMNLCPRCKVHYKKFQFTYCFSCSKDLGIIKPTLLERMGVTKEQEREMDAELDKIHGDI